MKKSLVVCLFAGIIFSCKKDKTTEFTATDVTGSSVIKGNLSKNVITPNGNGGFVNTTKIPANGEKVSVTIKRSSLYPNSTAQGADVYSGTTDQNGNYAITVRSNAQGVEAMITIDGFTNTLDTIVNGQVKKGLLTSFSGTTATRTVYVGQNIQMDYTYTGSNVSNNPNNLILGSASITGSVGMARMKEVLTGTFVTLTGVQVRIPEGHTVYLSFDKDPTTQAKKTYEAKTDSLGRYSFTISTVEAGTQGFAQNATIWVADFASSMDTIKINNTLKKGKTGVFKMPPTITQTGVYSNSIRNANYFFYGQNLFVAD